MSEIAGEVTGCASCKRCMFFVDGFRNLGFCRRELEEDFSSLQETANVGSESMYSGRAAIWAAKWAINHAMPGWFVCNEFVEVKR